VVIGVINKNIFMKNTVLIILTFLLFGCTQKSVVDIPGDPSKLNENKAYIKLTLETNSFLQYLSESAKTNSLNLPDVIKNLNIIKSKNLSFENQMIEIDRIYKSNVSTRLLKHMKIYSETWPEINKSYKNISLEILETEASEVLYDNLQSNAQNQIISYSVDKNIKANRANDCGWRYSLCVGAATAGAILCHAGCETTALVATAGLGIPICVLACGTLQAYAGLECYEHYCE
jgi:hypothetical protein